MITRKAFAAALSILPLAAIAADYPHSSKETAMTSRFATGPFDVKLAPQTLSSVAERSGLGRMSLDKQFHGALEATSSGEMIAFRSAVAGSAGYVAMETVRGTLDGRAGSFVLQHSSTLTRGEPTQAITVVPDSGTGALVGIAGRMVIDIAADGAHTYRLDYTLADAAR
jgi:hypothetical protein